MKLRACLFLLGVVLLAFLLGSVLAFEVYYAERIYPGVRVWNVDVGGLRPEQAAAGLEQDLGLDEPLVTLRGPDGSWGVRPTDLGLRLDPWVTLAPAYDQGRDQTLVDNLLTHLRLLAFGQDFSPVVIYDERVARLYLATLSEQVDMPTSDATLSLDGVTPIVNPAQPGRYLDVEATLAALRPAVARLAPAQVELVKALITITPGYDFGNDEEALKSQIIDFAKEKLAPYEVPKTISFMEELPLTTVGKIDKKVLRAQEKK